MISEYEYNRGGKEYEFNCLLESDGVDVPVSIVYEMDRTGIDVKGVYHQDDKSGVFDYLSLLSHSGRDRVRQECVDHYDDLCSEAEARAEGE